MAFPMFHVISKLVTFLSIVINERKLVTDLFYYSAILNKTKASRDLSEVKVYSFEEYI